MLVSDAVNAKRKLQNDILGLIYDFESTYKLSIAAIDITTVNMYDMLTDSNLTGVSDIQLTVKL